jgi:inorganic triphosphatase YgiF
MGIETNIDGAAPQLIAIKGRSGHQLRDLVGDATLRPLFETNVRRCEYLLGSADGGLVTLVLDETSIRIESSLIDSLCAEFALVSGDAGSILFVAEALFPEVGFRFGIESGAARAVRLIRHEEEPGPSPEKSVAEPLLPGQISTEAFASICRSATRQILQNCEPACKFGSVAISMIPLILL